MFARFSHKFFRALPMQQIEEEIAALEKRRADLLSLSALNEAERAEHAAAVYVGNDADAQTDLDRSVADANDLNSQLANVESALRLARERRVEAIERDRQSARAEEIALLEAEKAEYAGLYQREIEPSLRRMAAALSRADDLAESILRRSAELRAADGRPTGPVQVVEPYLNRAMRIGRLESFMRQFGLGHYFDTGNSLAPIHESLAHSEREAAATYSFHEAKPWWKTVYWPKWWFKDES